MDTTQLPHITKVELLKKGYLAACSCEWRGPFHPNPEPAVQDAIAHERNPWGPESQPAAIKAVALRQSRNGHSADGNGTMNGNGSLNGRH